jgi:hypothetical protein
MAIGFVNKNVPWPLPLPSGGEARICVWDCLRNVHSSSNGTIPRASPIIKYRHPCRYYSKGNASKEEYDLSSMYVLQQSPPQLQSAQTETQRMPLSHLFHAHYSSKRGVELVMVVCYLMTWVIPRDTPSEVTDRAAVGPILKEMV